MKKLLISALAMAAMATGVQATELKQPYGQLKKKIDIMSNIISTSLDNGENVHHSGGVSVKGVYLKSQGVVFEIEGGIGFGHIYNRFGDNDGFSFSFSDRGNIKIPPIAPIVIGDGDAAIDVEVAQRLEEAAVAYEEVMESFREQSEHTRDLREQQRDLAYELRDHARRKRDLEFEMRHADKDPKEIKNNMAELKKQMKQIELKRKEIGKIVEKEEKSLKEKREAQKKKLEKVEKRYLARLDDTIAQTLCDYGVGLRKLAKNERVTFIIDVAGLNNKGKKIHSFTKKDIISCVKENKTAQQLLKTADSYYF